MSGYIFHSEAYEDLDNILEFIANDSSDAADRLLDQFLEAMSNLARFPYQGHERADLTSRPLRFWPVRAYLIAYLPESNPLQVVAIVHGRRSPRTIAATLRAREQQRQISC